MTEKLPWLALRSIPGVGLVLFQRLVQALGSPAGVFEAGIPELRSLKGVTPAIAKAITSFKDWDRVEAQISRLAAAGAQVLTQDDPRFPARLLNIPYPPPYLFIRGALEAEDAQAVALVGTRAASYYGLKTCRHLAGALASRGWRVVSGLARGIDTAAHQGALEKGGRTLAVLGCGLDVVYPPENKKLYQQIPEQGALISEFPLGTPPEGRNFPVRNRLISGLSWAVVVVEAGDKSGTHITVQYALDQGREVLAVPGPVNSPNSVGPHRLIQQGAKLVHEVGDILQELPRHAGARPITRPGAVTEPPARPRIDDPLLPLLGADPVQLEELVQASHLPASEVLSRLTMLELQGLIKELPGKCFVLDAD
ncbi:MAG: DNA-processing protein DprA [Thermodesulfobacteriota bacterium]